ncbi:MAG: SIS domain-containing protein [Balneolales bacterium]
MEEQVQLSKNYLERYRSKTHMLARWVNDPQPKDGLVHTPSEIAQQPYLWNLTASMMGELAGKLKSFLEKNDLYNPSGRPQIIFTGAGTSDFVGQSLVDLFRKTFHTNCANWSTPRITANPHDFFDEHQHYILIHFARSGNSPESKAVLNLALKHYPDNVHHIVITCNQNGELAKTASAHPDKIFLIPLHPVSNDKGLAMTSSFSSMLVSALALVHLGDMKRYKEIIESMAASAEYFIDTYSDEIYQLSDPDFNRAFFLGNKDLLGAATESALKVQELTAGDLFTKSDDPLGFRHGPVSAVDGSSFVCFFLSEDPFTRRYEIDVIKQYHKTFGEMGAKTVVIGSSHDQMFKDLDVMYLSYNPEGKWEIPAHYQVNLAVLFGQLFGMFQAVKRKVNVDDPSTQKATYSRVVQGVQIYEI